MQWRSWYRLWLNVVASLSWRQFVQSAWRIRSISVRWPRLVLWCYRWCTGKNWNFSFYIHKFFVLVWELFSTKKVISWYLYLRIHLYPLTQMVAFFLHGTYALSTRLHLSLFSWQNKEHQFIEVSPALINFYKCSKKGKNLELKICLFWNLKPWFNIQLYKIW